MNRSVVATTATSDSDAAGRAIGEQIMQGLEGEQPDALILFAPPRYDYRILLRAVRAACEPRITIGGSSVGGFTRNGYVDDSAACAVALRSSEMRFAVGVGRDLAGDAPRAARDMVAPFEGTRSHEYLYRSAIVIVDALVGNADAFLAEVIQATGGTYQLFGGGAADGARMSRSDLFVDGEVMSDAAVGLEILSNKPLGVGLCQGWRATSEPMRVTAAHGNRVISLNAVPAVEMYQEHAERTKQRFDPASPMPFFLDNILGIMTPDGGLRLRVPVGANPDGSVTCAAEVPVGANVRIMATSAALASDAAESAVRRARQQLGQIKPQAAIFFDCLASRARMELGFGFDPRSLAAALGTSNYAGFSTCGQVVRAEGEFNGFQNCTAVVCVIPE